MPRRTYSMLQPSPTLSVTEWQQEATAPSTHSLFNRVKTVKIATEAAALAAKRISSSSRARRIETAAFHECFSAQPPPPPPPPSPNVAPSCICVCPVHGPLRGYYVDMNHTDALVVATTSHPGWSHVALSVVVIHSSAVEYSFLFTMSVCIHVLLLITVLVIHPYFALCNYLSLSVIFVLCVDESTTYSVSFSLQAICK
ncbi:hypothetical protein EG68_01781 [Paragonimus skrjabini miyazakii]|uniref:Uncharacterized protein n=1 Tax=Paragonimus skrjabini miyazakii TaxID=59628 RepID=A0A8S9ZBN9_9TREM|nr:hypothetical protein EG68_01781 [Paragonimus skrjabini miyazakii]